MQAIVRYWKMRGMAFEYDPIDPIQPNDVTHVQFFERIGERMQVCYPKMKTEEQKRIDWYTEALETFAESKQEPPPDDDFANLMSISFATLPELSEQYLEEKKDVADLFQQVLKILQTETDRFTPFFRKHSQVLEMFRDSWKVVYSE
jgi:hypothetical protein